MEQAKATKNGTDVRTDRRKKGAEELDFWASSLTGRKNGDGMYVVPSTSEIEAQVKEDIEFSKYRRQRNPDPTHIPANCMRFLKVESAFTALAARSAREVYGEWEALDAEGRKNWERYIVLARQRIRGVCHHLLVDKRPAGQWRDEQAFAVMSLYGVDRYGFEKWVRYKLDDVREFIGR